MIGEKALNETIARNIVNYLEKKNLSQIDLAEYMDVSAATVSNWCKGIKMPRMDKIDKICNFLNVTRSMLFNEQDTTQGHYADPEVEELAQELYDRPELKVLFSTTKKVSKEDLQFVQKMVDTMAKEKNGNDDDIC